LVLAAQAEQAQALSLANPATVTAIQQNAKVSATEVHWNHHGHHQWHRHWHHRHW
jgi:hypothetical protein